MVVMKAMASASSGLMHSYHNVAELRRFRGVGAVQRRSPTAASVGGSAAQPAEPLGTAAVHLDIEVANLLPQRVAVEAQQVRGADLVAPCRGQRRRQQRHLDLLEDPMVQSRRRP